MTTLVGLLKTGATKTSQADKVKQLLARYIARTKKYQ